MLENVKLTRVAAVQKGRTCQTFDIEVDSEMHAFVARNSSGGVGISHNSAQIAIGDCDDLQFLTAKKWSDGNIPNWRAYSNNSVVCNDIKLLPQAFWDTYDGGSEPYGLINLKLSRATGRIGDTQYKDPKVRGYNPLMLAA